MKDSRVVELDLLRFVAAAAVFLFHIVGRGFAFRPWTELGYLGVELFFMISGFVILWTGSSKNGWEFVASRVSRLYPSFWVGMFVSFAALTLTGTASISLPTLLANITMFPRMLGSEYIDYVYWTLQAEAIFYAFIFALIVAGQMRFIERWLWAWLALCGVSAVFGVTHDGIFNVLTLRGFGPFFIAGATLYLVRTQALTWPRAAMLVLCLLLGMPQGIYTADQTHPPLTSLGENTHLAIRLVVSALLLVFLALALRYWRLPRWRLWTVLGSMTYPLYLLHYRTNDSIRPLLPGSPLQKLLLFAVLVLLASLIMGLTVERYVCPAFNRALLRLGERLRLSRRSAVTSRLPAAEESQAAP